VYRMRRGGLAGLVGVVVLLVALVLLLAPVVSVDTVRGQVMDPDHPQDQSPPHRPPEGLTCGTCHQCEAPTRENPCLVICPRFHGMFHSQQGADDGPDIVIIDQLADLYGPIVFAHRLHAEMSDMNGGCENCHHYSDPTGTIPPCRECHDETKHQVDLQKPALKGAYHRQCMNCHLDWSHENACGFCHEATARAFATSRPDTTDIVGIPHPTIEAPPTYTYQTACEHGATVTFHHADHVDLFGTQCVDCHRGDSCGRCHDQDRVGSGAIAGHAGEDGIVAARLDHVTSCGACHPERDCEFCHSDQVMPRFEHASSTGWGLEPYHTEVGCEVCHGRPDSFRHPQTTCTSCHIHWEVGAFDHAVTGLALDEMHVDMDCEMCHLELDFGVAPSCMECHEEAMYPARVPGVRGGG